MCVVLSLPVPCESAIAPCVQDADKGLKKLKLEQQLVEQKEEERRQGDLKRKEYLVVERQRMEKARFDQRQATKQRLIDKASEELRNRINTEDKRLEDQVEAMRKKEDDLEELKQRNIMQQKAAIDISRQQQLEARLRIKEREEQEIRDMVATWKAKNIEIEASALCCISASLSMLPNKPLR